VTKATGSYYTPLKLSEFIWNRVSTQVRSRPFDHILEPSCGEGVFLDVILRDANNSTCIVDVIEINRKVLSQTKKHILESYDQVNVNFLSEDFLTVPLAHKYDLIIGNPPYIAKNLLSKEQQVLCQNIHRQGDLSYRSVQNIWPAFVIKATLSLNMDGVLAFVLPGELLQVKYAEEIQDFLCEQFEYIELVSFQELIFPALGQDVVILLAYKKSPTRGIYHAQARNIESLSHPLEFSLRTSVISTNNIKWSNFILETSEFEFIAELAERTLKVSDYCTSTPGIVTAANKFFIVNQETAEKHELMSFCKPILQKSELVGNVVCLDETIFQELVANGKPCYLIDIGDEDPNTLPQAVQKYLQSGKERNLHKRYKTSRRNPWYNIPSVWVPDGVIFKRCHIYPKLLKNNAEVLFTDTAYRIRMRNGFDIDSFICSFYNSLTLVFCELFGRFYGGGVLELTPNEFQKLPIPYKQISTEEFSRFKETFTNQKPIESFLKSIDNQFLEPIGLQQAEIEQIWAIRQKLLARRLRSKSLNM